jgi:archaemetzincin
VNVIRLLSLGDADPHIVEALRSPVHQAFKVPVELTGASIDVKRSFDETRGQYNSTSILHQLRNEQPEPKLLAVIAGDLFIPVLTYVFGEAELGGNVAIVSYHRLKNERYGLPPDHTLLIERVCKEAIHELGHAYGLKHCLSLECVMHTSTYVEDIDRKGASFCVDCRERLARASR